MIDRINTALNYAALAIVVTADVVLAGFIAYTWLHQVGAVR